MELTKDSLRKEFSKKYKEFYDNEMFREKGFTRKQCRICKRFFWSLEDRDVCDDPSHTKYSFFKERAESVDYVEFWKKFAGAFKASGHALIDRYPVVSRWRQDLYFTIAGIQDFQRIENGKMEFEYPANPLMVPQICLRFSDIENVGITGRHFTSFMMANQTAFNWPKEGYWRDETMKINYDVLTKVLKAKPENIVFHEDVWAMPDFSEFGPCIESFSNGLEIVNSVFTQFELLGGAVKELSGKVVDVGWGFERALWFYSGATTSYDVAFEKIIKELLSKESLEYSGKHKEFFSNAGLIDFTESNEGLNSVLKRLNIKKEEYEKEIAPLSAIYATIDHSRTLLFAITDGAIPSNIGGGYNLRVILRRALDFIAMHGFSFTLSDVAALHAKVLKGLFPELEENLDTFAKIEEIEKKRYMSSKEKGRKLVESTIRKGKISEEELKVLYESHGVTPEFISEIAKEKGVQVDMPQSYYTKIIQSDIVKKEKKKLDIQLPDLPNTKQLYYEMKSRAKAKVLFSKGDYVVLDQTPFYPEGGGQAPDLGKIKGIEVVDVQKIGGVIVHKMKKNLIKEGEEVDAEVDVERRLQLMAHHTATHLMSAAARKILGKHAWQEGAKKDVDKARIDVVHYEKLSAEVVEEIEDLVNDWIRKGINVEAKIMERGEAEKKYGFSIYQGHGVPSKNLRIILITSKDGSFIDAEACGGLHSAGVESLLGMVKIIGVDRPHDGIVRFEYVAGKAALEAFRKDERIIEELEKELNERKENLTNRVIGEIRGKADMKKEYEREIDSLIKAIIEQHKSERVEEHFEVKRDIARKIARALVEKGPCRVSIVEGKDGYVVCAVKNGEAIDALEELRRKYKERFRGGGARYFAEGVVI
ncbi:MAG: alanine--tRNA ligase [Candidatus Micrarchaeaceae archaeon]